MIYLIIYFHLANRHSMGGGILQHYLQDNHQKVSGGVLLTTVSPYLHKTSFFKPIYIILSNRPILPLLKALVTLNLYAVIETPELMKGVFFSSAYPDAMAREIHPKFEKSETINGLFELGKPFTDPSKIKCPIIVIGAEEDTIPENLKVISETAEAYGVGFDMIGGAGHAVMLDLTWEDAANVIFNRIQERIKQKMILTFISYFHILVYLNS